MRITLPSGTPAEFAAPTAPADLGVVLIPDIGGLRPLFDEMCARLATQKGWLVCAPEPFPGRESMELADRMAAMKDREDDVVLNDITEAALQLQDAGAPATAVIGFCQGGMYAFKAAGSGDHAGVVAFYGMIRVPDDWRGPKQLDPLEYLQREGASPTLAILGGQDPWTPQADIDALRGLANVEIAFYPDADHGFVHDPSRPSHRPDDARDAWHRAFDFLETATP